MHHLILALDNLPDFSKENFACKCGHPDCTLYPEDEERITNLLWTADTFQKICTETGIPVVFNSFYRCLLHPIEAKKPQPGAHNYCLAGDMKTNGENHPKIIQAWRRLVPKAGIGIYKTFLHLDRGHPTRTRPVTWSQGLI